MGIDRPESIGNVRVGHNLLLCNPMQNMSDPNGGVVTFSSIPPGSEGMENLVAHE